MDANPIKLTTTEMHHTEFLGFQKLRHDNAFHISLKQQHNEVNSMLQRMLQSAKREGALERKDILFLQWVHNHGSKSYLKFNPEKRLFSLLKRNFESILIIGLMTLHENVKHCTPGTAVIMILPISIRLKRVKVESLCSQS